VAPGEFDRREQPSKGSQVNFASFKFFLFLVRPYSIGYARARGRKLLVASGFVRAGGVI
jgi:hypothetical protein